MATRVAGFCPMGCGETLVVTFDRQLRCKNVDCPDRECLHDILQDSETEHIIDTSEAGWVLLHPLRERKSVELVRCELNDWLMGLDEAPVAPGRYRVTRHRADPVSESRRSDAGPYDFERIGEWGAPRC